jgi:RecA/RadA recombinase
MLLSAARFAIPAACVVELSLPPPTWAANVQYVVKPVAEMKVGPLPKGPHTGARARDADPLSTVQALMDAEQAFDLDRAMSLFADDAVIVNAAGARTAGADNLKRFLDEDMRFNDSFTLERPLVEDNRVSWTKSVTADFYSKLGVAPVQFAFTAVIDKGKIDSIVAHVPRNEIARIEEACQRNATEPVIYGRNCNEFIQDLKKQADFASGFAGSGRS